MRLKTMLVALAACLMISSSHGYIAIPLGTRDVAQNMRLTLTPPQVRGVLFGCNISNVPIRGGYAQEAPGPMFVQSPTYSGSHIVEFKYDTAQFLIEPILAPGNTTLQIDARDKTNPLFNFDSSISPANQSGVLHIYLTDPAKQQIVCKTQIQFMANSTMIFATYGGVYPQPGKYNPPGADGVQAPSGWVYAPEYVSEVVKQNFLSPNPQAKFDTIVDNVSQITGRRVNITATLTAPNPLAFAPGLINPPIPSQYADTSYPPWDGSIGQPPGWYQCDPHRTDGLCGKKK